jgi:ATP-dependent 26S proteasome regulatory subunit
MPRIDQEIGALIKARNTLLWITSREEMRVERGLLEAAAIAKTNVRFWDCATGLSDASNKPVNANLKDPVAMLETIRDTARDVPCLYVLRDMHAWRDPVTVRMLRTLQRELQSSRSAIAILSPSSDIPPDIASVATVIDYPLPTRDEIARALDDTIASVPDKEIASKPFDKNAAVDAAIGLTSTEAENCFAKSLVTEKAIVPAVIGAEKKRVVAREKVLTWIDPDPRGLDAVGGLDNLKAWLRQRRLAFSAEAREYGLPRAKGVFLVGLPGTGKSLTAKAVASAYGVPLLRLDLGALQNKFVGESQANMRKALALAETVAPCVVWIDEIEKALAGATQGAADGGVSADQLGAFLSWQQDCTANVFVIATANDVSALPPELLRKGRFDEVFFSDLPNAQERAQVLAASMRAFPARFEEIDAARVSEATAGFSGAEIAAIVPDAMFAAFGDGKRQVTTEDLLSAAKTVVPLAKTAAEKIAKLREWAKGRARLASSPENEMQVTGRKIDVG